MTKHQKRHWTRRGAILAGIAAPFGLKACLTRKEVRAQAGSGRARGLAVPPPVWPVLPVSGSDTVFPVRRIYCIGFNYAEHLVEMSRDPREDKPVIFDKFTDGIVADGATIPYPMASDNLHHEVELVVAIGREGRRVGRDTALDHVFGYAVGNDLTRRDIQAEDQPRGRPWTAAKAFDHAAPCGVLHRPADAGHPGKGAIWLTVNGEKRQDSDLSHMIWKVPDIISAISALFELRPGDLIFTGTPEGVGPVVPGDEMIAGIDGLGTLTTRVGPRV